MRCVDDCPAVSRSRLAGDWRDRYRGAGAIASLSGPVVAAPRIHTTAHLYVLCGKRGDPSGARRTHGWGTRGAHARRPERAPGRPPTAGGTARPPPAGARSARASGATDRGHPRAPRAAGRAGWPTGPRGQSLSRARGRTRKGDPRAQRTRRRGASTRRSNGAHVRGARRNSRAGRARGLRRREARAAGRRGVLRRHLKLLGR